MAIDPKLLRDWIQYLKNNRIVSMNSDPATGQLTYKKPVTADMVHKFLSNQPNLDPKEIASAIQQVVFGKASGTAPTLKSPTTPSSTPAPQSAPVSASRPHAANQPMANPAAANHSPFNVPRTPKPHYKLATPGAGNVKPKVQYKGLKEAMAANPGATLDEKDVEKIFSIVSSGMKKSGNTPKPTAPAAPTPNAPLTSTQKIADLNKIKKTIRDTMNAQQRSTLYRALSDDGNLFEQEVTTADAKAILKGAASLRNNPGIVKSIPGLRKDKVNLADLQTAWKNAGYPDDTQEIAAILHNKFGYNYKEVKKVFSKVFGVDKDEEHGYANQSGTPAMQKIADYIKKVGLTAEVKQYLEDNYSEELGLSKPSMFRRVFKKKAVTEEIRQIFEEIINEERTDRLELIQIEERTQLGRSKK